MSNQVATTILEQLGNNKFIVMTGATRFLSTENSLQFRIPGKGFTKGGINSVKITLELDDTYTMEFGKVWGMDYKKLSEHRDVYCDMLQDLFTEETGLDTHL